MADPAMAAARSVDALTDETLPGLPMTDVDRVESDLLAEVGVDGLDYRSRHWRGCDR